jgi:hypothetical protein
LIRPGVGENARRDEVFNGNAFSVTAYSLYVREALGLIHAVQRGKFFGQPIQLQDEFYGEYIARSQRYDNYPVVTEGVSRLVEELKRAVVARKHFGRAVEAYAAREDRGGEPYSGYKAQDDDGLRVKNDKLRNLIHLIGSQGRVIASAPTISD